MVDLLITRVLPAALFGLATGGLLWLIGLLRKRAALTCAMVLALVFLAARWPATMLVTTQVALTACAGRLLLPNHRLRMRDVVALTAASVVVVWGAFAASTPAYWNAGLAGGLAGAACAWAGRAGSSRWSGAKLRMLTLRPAVRAGINGPGVVAGLSLAITLSAAAVGFGLLGPGEPALAVVGAALGAAVSDFVFRGRPGLVLGAGGFAAVFAAALAAALP